MTKTECEIKRAQAAIIAGRNSIEATMSHIEKLESLIKQIKKADKLCCASGYDIELEKGCWGFNLTFSGEKDSQVYVFNEAQLHGLVQLIQSHTIK